MGATLAYESRDDTRARSALRWRRRTGPPSRAFRLIAWIGIGFMWWGSSALPGGAMVLLAGILLAPLGVVPIAVWELIVRPSLLLAGEPVPSVGGRWWMMLAFVLVGDGYVTNSLGPITASILRPVWTPFAAYYYEQRPAIAPVPRTILFGPYVLTNARITPGGIRGDVPGGGQIAIGWDEINGYSFRSDPLRVR